MSIGHSPEKVINKKLARSLLEIYWPCFGVILYVTMVYGPIAAFLSKCFRQKSVTLLCLPYHIGNGVFGGLVPFIGLLLTTTYPSDPLVGFGIRLE